MNETPRPQEINYKIEPTPEAVLRLFEQVKFSDFPDDNYDQHTQLLAKLSLVEKGIQTLLSDLKNGDPVHTREAMRMLHEMFDTLPVLYERIWPIIEQTVAAKFPEHAVEQAGFPAWDRYVGELKDFGETFVRVLSDAPLLKYAQRAFPKRLKTGMLLLMALQGAARELPEHQKSSAEIDAAALIAEPLTEFQKIVRSDAFESTLETIPGDLLGELQEPSEDALEHAYTQSELFEVLSMQRSFEKSDVESQIEMSMRAFPEEWGFAKEDAESANTDFEQAVERVQKRVWDFITFVNGDFGSGAEATQITARNTYRKPGAGMSPIQYQFTVERQQDVIRTWLKQHARDISVESHNIGLFEEFVEEQEALHPGPVAMAQLVDEALPWGVMSFTPDLGTGHRSYEGQVQTLINAGKRLGLDVSRITPSTHDSSLLRPLHSAVKDAGVLVAYPGTSNHGGGRAIDVKIPDGYLAPLHEEMGRVLDTWAESDERIQNIVKEKKNGIYGVHHIDAEPAYIDLVVDQNSDGDAVAMVE